jgi:hypothetical protein
MSYFDFLSDLINQKFLNLFLTKRVLYLSQMLLSIYSFVFKGRDPRHGFAFYF